MTTVNEIFIAYQECLSHLYEPAELEQITLRAFEHCCSFSRADLVLRKDEQLSPHSITQLNQILHQLKGTKPIQYVLGYSWFMDHKFIVSPDVLIPRPETEELVNWVLNDLKEFSKIKLNVLDLCTGSGCIPISLSLNNPDWLIAACDISEKALDIAVKNNEVLQSNVNFFQCDILKWKTGQSMSDFLKELFGSTNNLDLITSNPPYVLMKEKSAINERVLNHEPSIALFVPDEDPLIFYSEIAALASDSLRSGGRVVVEINRDQAEGVIDLFKKQNFSDIILKTDINDNPRMISATLNY